MSKSTTNGPVYKWGEVKDKILKGVSYTPGSPFNYRHQLRIKVTTSTLIYTFWDFAKCVHSGQIQGTETAIWEELNSELNRQSLLQIPCVSVSVSVWNDMSVLLRPENSSTVPLDTLNRALREQPDKIRKDLQVNGVYGFTAMPCDASKLFIFGIPLGYAIKGALARFPKDWIKVAWFGPTATPLMAHFNAGLTQNLYHTILLQNTAISLMIQSGKLKFLQQDKALVEAQPISQNSISRIKGVYSYFSPGDIKHFIHPLEASNTYAATLRTCIQALNVTTDVQIIPSLKIKLAGIPDDVQLQDMFPTGLPWQA